MAKKTPDTQVDLTVTLELEDNSSLECGVRHIFTANDKAYIALTPMDQWNKPDCDVFLYGYLKDDNGEATILNIEDEEEFDIALDALYEEMDLEYYEELVPAEDEEA